MSVESFDIYSKPLDYFQNNYLRVVKECLGHFEHLNNPKLTEKYYFQEENSKLMQTYTGLSVKIILSFLTEYMQYMLSEDGRYDYDYDEYEFMPLVIKDGQIKTFFLYRYMEKLRLVRKLVPTGFDVDYCLLNAKQLKYLDISNVQFMVDPAKDKEFKEKVRNRNLRTYETETRSDFGMQDADSNSEYGYNTFDWGDRENLGLIRSYVKAFEAMHNDLDSERMDEAEAEDYRLVRQAQNIGVMPWELLPLKDEYRNKPFEEWDFKPIFPVVDYDFGSYGYFQFKSYGSRDDQMLAEQELARVLRLKDPLSQLYDIYTPSDKPYVNELLNAMKAGRKQLDEKDFQEFFEPLKYDRASHLAVLSELRGEVENSEEIKKYEQAARLKESGGYYDLPDLDEIEFAIYDIQREIMGEYIDFLDDDAPALSEYDELYGCTLDDDEFYEFAKNKFFWEVKSFDPSYITDWNRKHVYPKILQE